MSEDLIPRLYDQICRLCGKSTGDRYRALKGNKGIGDILSKYNRRNNNQKFVLMKKTQSDDEHLYSKTNIEAALAAHRALSDRAFRVYHRLSLHAPEYYFDLSPKEIENNTGFKTGGQKWTKIVDELIEKGYLEAVDGYLDMYIFYEYPQRDNPAFMARSLQNVGTPPSELEVPLPTNSTDPSLQIVGTPPYESEGQIQYISQDTVSNTTGDITAGSACGSNSILSPERESEIASDPGDLYKDSELVAPDYRDAHLLLAIEELKRKEEETRFENLNAGTGGIYLALYDRLLSRMFPERRKKPIVKFLGWDEKRNEPIMVWTPCYVPPHLLKQNVDELRATWSGYNDAVNITATLERDENEAAIEVDFVEIGDNNEVAVEVDFSALADDDGDLPF